MYTSVVLFLPFWSSPSPLVQDHPSSGPRPWPWPHCLRKTNLISNGIWAPFPWNSHAIATNLTASKSYLSAPCLSFPSIVSHSSIALGHFAVFIPWNPNSSSCSTDYKIAFRFFFFITTTTTITTKMKFFIIYHLYYSDNLLQHILPHAVFFYISSSALPS